MYRISLNVQLSDSTSMYSCTLRPIPYIEAESLHSTLRQNRLNVQSASILHAASMYSSPQFCVQPQCTVCLILRMASMYSLPQFCARPQICTLPQCTVCLNFAHGLNVQSASILHAASMYTLPQFCAWLQCTVCLNFVRGLKSARGLNVQSASILRAASM